MHFATLPCSRIGPSRASGRSAAPRSISPSQVNVVAVGGSFRGAVPKLQSAPMSPRSSPRLRCSQPLSPRPETVSNCQSSGPSSMSYLPSSRPSSIRVLPASGVMNSSPPRRTIATSSTAGSVSTVAFIPSLSAVAKSASIAREARAKANAGRLPNESMKLASTITLENSVSTGTLRNSASQCCHLEHDESDATLDPKSFGVVLDSQTFTFSADPQNTRFLAPSSITQLSPIRTSALVTPATPSSIPRTRIVKFVRVVQAIFRMQSLAAAPALTEAKAEAMLRRIRNSLASDRAYRSGCEEVFSSLKESCAELPFFKLPLARLDSVLNRWQIPHDHIPLFWSILRQSAPDSYKESVMPPTIDENTFSSVLANFLRRVRNKHSMHIARKDNFIVRNQRIFENEYEEKGSIGSGSFGECIWVEHRFTKRRYACKRISVVHNDMQKDEVEAELEVMKRLDHPNVLRVFEWFETDSMYTLVLEPAYGGDLKGLLARRKDEGDGKGLDEPLVVQITVQVLHALAYMHSQQCLHRDVKPANMLLAKELEKDYKEEDLAGVQVLLADFGLAELCGEHLHSPRMLVEKRRPSKDKKNTLCGTLAYMALEVFNGAAAPASDIWALGISVYELLTQQRPIKVDNQMAFYVALKKKDIDIDVVRQHNASDGAIQFLSLSLKRDAALRPTAQEALQMKWFTDWFQDATNSNSLLAQKKFKRAISQFRRSNTFCKAVAICSASQLDSSRVMELNKAFKAIDKDMQGTLSREELKEGLRRIGLEGADSDSIFDALDVDRDGTVNYSEFIASLIPTQGLLEDELLARAFNIFDTDGNGSITSCELHSMLSGTNQIATMLPEGTTIEDMLKDIDTSGDGCISYEEFKAYFHRQQSHDRRGSMDEEEVNSSNAPLFNSADSTNGGNSPNNLDRKKGQEPLRCVFENLSAQLSMQCIAEDLPDAVAFPDFQVLCERHAQRLAEQHWLVYVSDLGELQPGDWPHLGLPLKLQNMLKVYIGLQ